MKNNDIIYTTPEEQIKKLQSQHLLIEDYDSAIEALELFGYSNLIKNAYEVELETAKEQGFIPCKRCTK